MAVASVGLTGWLVYHSTRRTIISTTKPATASVAIVSATDGDNGKTITLRTNDKLTLSLPSTYWTIAKPSNTHVIELAGNQVTTPSRDCVPGGGCGTAVAHFTAVSVGSAHITASRTTCGEALACTGNQGSFSLTVVVK